MPDLNTLLNTANAQSESIPAKKKLSRGIRPDHIARGEVLPVNTNPPAIEPNLATQTVSKEVANSEQTVSKEVANSEQTVSKVAATNQLERLDRNETVSATVSSSVSKVAANNKQTVSKAVAEPVISSLVGLQRSIVFLIFNECQLNRSEVSPPLSLEHIVNNCGSTEKTVKNAIYRLTKKNYLSRVQYKDGRGGWTQYGLPKSIYQSILNYETVSKVLANDKQTVSKVAAKPEAQPEAGSPIVVVKEVNSKNTTNTEEPCFVIPNELLNKVSRRQLSEFVLAGKISEYDLQLSLDAFAFDLRNKLVSTKYSNNPVGVLIGSIKNNGSYNSAKFVEAVKAEMKPIIEAQRETTAIKTDQRSSNEWESFQKFKFETPEDYKLLESKVAHFGFSGAMLEEFTFLEFKKVILKIEEEPINPLRPPVSATP